MVVASDVGSLRRAVVDGVTGLLVPPDAAAALVAALGALVDDAARRARMGAAARARLGPTSPTRRWPRRTTRCIARGSGEASAGVGRV
jgi:hypothetical protein